MSRHDEDDNKTIEEGKKCQKTDGRLARRGAGGRRSNSQPTRTRHTHTHTLNTHTYTHTQTIFSKGRLVASVLFYLLVIEFINSLWLPL
jgi:hypothetical protein